jgi:hypothetical protein
MDARWLLRSLAVIGILGMFGVLGATAPATNLSRLKVEASRSAASKPAGEVDVDPAQAPEPSTYLLLGFALVGLAAAGRRRHR